MGWKGRRGRLKCDGRIALRKGTTGRRMDNNSSNRRVEDWWLRTLWEKVEGWNEEETITLTIGQTLASCWSTLQRNESPTHLFFDELLLNPKRQCSCVGPVPLSVRGSQFLCTLYSWCLSMTFLTAMERLLSVITAVHKVVSSCIMLVTGVYQWPSW